MPNAFGVIDNWRRIVYHPPICIKTTPNSPRRSVQVVGSVRSGDKVSRRIVRYVGIALDSAEQGKLRAIGQEFIDKQLTDAFNAGALFTTEPGAVRLLAKRGRPAR